MGSGASSDLVPAVRTEIESLREEQLTAWINSVPAEDRSKLEAALAQPAQAEPMTVDIKRMFGETFSLEVTTTTTCLDMKELIHEREGIAKMLQELVFKRKRLDNPSQTLSEAGILHGSCLTLLVMEATKEEKEEPVRVPGQEYSIVLDKTSGVRLGIDVDNQDGCTLLVESICSNGLVPQWNAKNPNMTVQTDDRIVDVNGMRGDLLKLVAECKKNCVLTVTLLAHAKPKTEGSAAVMLKGAPMVEARKMCGPVESGSPSQEYTIMLDKTHGTRLGVDVDNQDGKSLVVDALQGSGLVHDWNTANPSLQVKPGHRIVDVNGSRGDLQRMVSECKRNCMLKMTLAW